MIPKETQKKRTKTKLRHEIDDDIEDYFSETKPVNTDNTIEELKINTDTTLEELRINTEKGIVDSKDLPLNNEVGS